MQVYQLLLPQSYLLSFYLALEITLKFNSFEQELNSLRKIHVSSEKNLSFQILRPQRRIIILKRRNLVFEERIMGIVLRLRILIIKSCVCLILVKRILVFFPQEQNSFAKNQLMRYSSEKKHCSPPKMISI